MNLKDFYVADKDGRRRRFSGGKPWLRTHTHSGKKLGLFSRFTYSWFWTLGDPDLDRRQNAQDVREGR